MDEGAALVGLASPLVLESVDLSFQVLFFKRLGFYFSFVLIHLINLFFYFLLQFLDQLLVRVVL